MATFDFTNLGDQDVVLDSITLLHEGFGDIDNIEGVYLSENGQRISRIRDFDDEDLTVDLRISSPVSLDPGETFSVDVFVDFDTTADSASEHNIVLDRPSDVGSNTDDINGDFPIRSSTKRIAAVTTGIVNLQYRTVTPGEIEPGDTNETIGKGTITVDDNADQTIYGVQFENNGTTDANSLGGVYITRTDGTVLTDTVAFNDSFFLTFNPPFTVLEGDSFTFEVKTLEVNGDVGDTVIVNLDEDPDFYAVDALYGYGVNGQLYYSETTVTTPPFPSTVTIGAPEMSIDVTGSASTVTVDDNDVVLGEFEYRTDVQTLINQQTFMVAITDAHGDLVRVPIGTLIEDVEMRDTVTGRTHDLLLNEWVYAAGIYELDDAILREGMTNLQFRVDLIDNGSENHLKDGDQLVVLSCTTTGTADFCDYPHMGANHHLRNLDVETLSTGESIDVRPGGLVQGNPHTVATPHLTVVEQALPAFDTTVEGGQNKLLGRVKLVSNGVEDLLLTEIEWDADNNIVQNASFWIDTDGDGDTDTVMEDGVAFQNGSYTFSDLVGAGFVLTDEPVIGELRGDFNRSVDPLNNQIQVTLNSVDGEELDDGTNLNPTQLTYFRTPQTVWTADQHGTASFTKDNVPVREKLAQLGERVLIDQYTVAAETEAADVYEIIISTHQELSSIDRLILSENGIDIAVGTYAGCGASETPLPGQRNLCFNMHGEELVVAAGEQRDFELYAQFKSEGTGGINNELIQTSVISGWMDVFADGAVKVRGMESSNNYGR